MVPENEPLLWRYFVFNFYLKDDELDIHELEDVENDVECKIFLKKMKLPKNWLNMSCKLLCYCTILLFI